MGAPSWERLVLLHACPDGDFFENTRGSQRVKVWSKTFFVAWLQMAETYWIVLRGTSSICCIRVLKFCANFLWKIAFFPAQLQSRSFVRGSAPFILPLLFISFYNPSLFREDNIIARRRSDVYILFLFIRTTAFERAFILSSASIAKYRFR